MNIQLFHQKCIEMLTAKSYIAYILILFPLLLDLIIACYIDKAKLLVYLSLKILLLVTNELVTHSYKKQAQRQDSNQMTV